MSDDPYEGLHDRDAELAVVGAVLFAEHTWQQASAQVDGGDFHHRECGRLFAAAEECWKANERPDPLSLPPRMGGHWRSTVLLEATGAFVGNVNRPCSRVAELAARRRLLEAGDALRAAARDQTLALADVVSDQQARLADAHAPVSPVESGPDIDTFLAQNEGTDWLIPGLLERCERVILTGEEGKGKSTCLRQLAVQAAAGIKPFTTAGGNLPVRAMIVDCENSKGQIQRQLRPLRAKVPDMNPDRLTVLCRPQGLDLLHRADRKWFEERVNANRPDLVVTGPLYKLHGGDPNEERPAANLRDFFDNLRVRYGFALLLEAHQPYAPSGQSKRPLRPYGASLWSRWPEIGVGLLADGQTWRLAQWRGMREARSAWPPILVRGGSWPWLAGSDAGRPV